MGLTRKQYKRQRKSRNQQKRLKKRKQQKRKTKKRGQRVRKGGSANFDSVPGGAEQKQEVLMRSINEHFDSMVTKLYTDYASEKDEYVKQRQVPIEGVNISEIQGKQNINNMIGKKVLIVYHSTEYYIGFYKINKIEDLPDANNSYRFQCIGEFDGYMKESGMESPTKIYSENFVVIREKTSWDNKLSVIFWRPIG